jgi:hypothetical protein
MRLQDLVRTFEVVPAVVDLINTVEQQTGKPVDFRIDRSSTAPASVKIARNRMACHLVTLNPAFADTASYLIANKCSNILRVARLHSEDRVVPATTDATLRAATDQLLKLDPTTTTLSPATLTYLVTGVVNQLANLAVQIRIERWLSTRFPELIDQQRRYLEADVAQTLAGVTPEVERSVPATVFARSNAMTYAFVRAMGALVGANYTQRHNGYPSIVRTGRTLYSLVGNSDDESARSDVQLIDAWAAELSLTEWFIWQDFESMPESYFADTGCSDSPSPAL